MNKFDAFFDKTLKQYSEAILPVQPRDPNADPSKPKVQPTQTAPTPTTPATAQTPAPAPATNAPPAPATAPVTNPATTPTQPQVQPKMDIQKLVTDLKQMDPSMLNQIIQALQQK